jgi:hypothetical protein
MLNATRLRVHYSHLFYEIFIMYTENAPNIYNGHSVRNSFTY